MSSVIHQILPKTLNETSEVLLTIDVLVQSTDAQLYCRHFSFHFKLKAAQCYAGLQTIVAGS